MKKAARYGTWPSSITAELMCSSSVGLSHTCLFEDEVYWLESRPAEQGRNVIVKQAVSELAAKNGAPLKSSQATDVIPAKFNCRTQVHEYGGACFLPTPEGVFFVNHNDQQVYKVKDDRVVAVTNQPHIRFADFAFSPQRGMLVAIAEDHGASATEPDNSLVAIDTSTGAVSTLHRGEDFYASACFSPDGGQLCWISWMHPNMPWDGTTLWKAAVTDNTSVVSPEIVAGGATESVFQPEWSPGGVLYFVSDRSDWWNIYRESEGGVESICSMNAEFGLPQWVFGMRRYGFIDDENIVSSYAQNGSDSLALINTTTGEFTDVPKPHSSYQWLNVGSGMVCYVAQSPTTFASVYVCATDAIETEFLVRHSSTIEVSPENFSSGVSITYPSAGGVDAYGFYYPPVNTEHEGLTDELPPLIVMIHGGPTSSTQNDLSLKIQFWTNRGFAVFDSNYRGSTGFGRKYRDALKTRWGVVDVEDCDYGVRYLVEKKLVDPNRVAIRGGSAGGFTTLAALASTDTFKAGASLYGVTDLTAIATDTHKFESRYLDSLIGPYPGDKALYESRSPSNHADAINCPVIFLQGLDDKIVPPSQAEMMIEVLLEKGLKVAYLPFEGEGHGFRQSDTIIKAFSAELWFYGEVFGFDVDKVEGVDFLGAWQVS